MEKRHVVATTLAGALACTASLLAAAQNPALAPKTIASASTRPGLAGRKVGIPELESSSVGWSKVANDFEPSESGPGPVTYAKDHPYVPNNNSGRQVTFRIADLDNPILKPWAIEKMREQNELAAAGKRAYEARASCRPGGVPGFLVMGRVNPLYIVQGKNEVILINEGGPEVRRVFLDVPHSANPKISPYRESVGYYEGGDTLVVDTIGLADDTYVDNYRKPHTTQLHVIERFQVTDGGNTLRVTVRVKDPRGVQHTLVRATDLSPHPHRRYGGNHLRREQHRV